MYHSRKNIKIIIYVFLIKKYLNNYIYMQNIVLTLKTSDINLSDIQATYLNDVVTSRGSITNSKKTFTWNNVNMKNLLGEWYNNYDSFNICLVCISQSYQAAQYGATIGGGVNKDNVVMVKMSGLQWLSSYDQKTGTNTGIVIVALRNFNEYHLTKNNYITFLKGTPNTNITISLDNVSTDAPLTTDEEYVFGNMVFSFNITPVEKPSK